jgi:hypothetical protein
MSNWTPRAREFATRNKTSEVVAGAWLDAKGRNVCTWGDRVRLRFRFDDGTSLSLRDADLVALSANGHAIRWHGLASADTHPEGGDGEAAPYMSGAVPEADAQP